MDENRNMNNIPDDTPEEKKLPKIFDDNTNDFQNNTEYSDDAKKAVETLKKSRFTKGVKLVYGFALVLAICGAFAAKLATEKALGSIKTPIENQYTEKEKPTSKDSHRLTERMTEAANDVKNVPDMREPDEKSDDAQSEVKVTVYEAEANAYAEPYSDNYDLPLGTKISKDYSPEVPAYSATMGDWRTHCGVDFSGAVGSPVKAVSAGTVTGIYNDDIYGQVVEIDHGNKMVARYCGFEADSLEISVGSEVKRGDLLGYLGTIPCERSETSHLHFETAVDGKNDDPIAVLGRG